MKGVYLTNRCDGFHHSRPPFTDTALTKPDFAVLVPNL